MDRRTFLKGLVATAAGVLVPGHVAAEPERRVWALDGTMVSPVRRVHLEEHPYLDPRIPITTIQIAHQEIVTAGGLDWEPGDYMNIGGEWMKILSEEPTMSWTHRYTVERYPNGYPTLTARPE
jgi:hypothetical protein